MKAIRQNAPASDRNDRALIPTKPPEWFTGRDGTAYVHISLYPRTLDELEQMSRSFGTAAVAKARGSAIGVWLMKSYPAPECLRNPMPVAGESIRLMEEHDQFHLGWPHYAGKEAERPQPTLDGITPSSRREAILVATETAEDWEAAGRPYLDADRIKHTFQYLVSTPAFQAKYMAVDTPAPAQTQEIL